VEWGGGGICGGGWEGVGQEDMEEVAEAEPDAKEMHPKARTHLPQRARAVRCAAHAAHAGRAQSLARTDGTAPCTPLSTENTSHAAQAACAVSTTRCKQRSAAHTACSRYTARATQGARSYVRVQTRAKKASCVCCCVLCSACVLRLSHAHTHSPA
jgi:hypothetical protein